MKYVYIDTDRTVRYIIPDFVDEFPGVSIDQRYSKDFLSKCLETEDDVEVEEMWEYIPMHNVFAPAIKYKGDIAVNITAGAKSRVNIEFSGIGSWTVHSSSGDIVLKKTVDAVDVSPISTTGVYTIDVLFTEDKYDRIVKQQIDVVVQ